MTGKTLWATAALLIVMVGTAMGDSNLVVNGGFETGNFTGWTLTGNTGNTLVNTALPFEGTYDAALGPVGSQGFLTQSANLTTIAGQDYTFSFELQNNGGTPSSFSAYWDNTLLFTLNNAPAFFYALESFTVTGTGSDNIRFQYQNDPSFWHLDAVSVTPAAPVPEPASLCLLGTGAAALLALRRKQRT